MGRSCIALGKTETALLSGKKAAAYIRVSLETDRLSHSLSAQAKYYTDLITAATDLELVGIYADDFISGTEAERRPEFRRLMTDCEGGKEVPLDDVSPVQQPVNNTVIRKQALCSYCGGNYTVGSCNSCPHCGAPIQPEEYTVFANDGENNNT